MLLVNKIKTPDGTILQSRHRHDFCMHVDSNGETYINDGGLDYIRRSVNNEPAEDMSVYSHDYHEKIRENFTWGTYGKNGDEPLQYKLLKDLTDNHIKAILETQTHIPEEMRQMFKNELEWRDEKPSSKESE